MNKVIGKDGKEIKGEAFHPGEILKEELEAREITQEEFVILIGYSQSLISNICNGKRDITINFALKLEKLWDISAEYLLGMQLEYNIQTARNKLNKT